MKIAYIVPSLANRGPIIVVRDLVAVMSVHGHECTIYHFDNIREMKFPCKTEKISFFHKIDFSSYDIVHSHGIRPDAYVFLHKPKYDTMTVYISTLHNFVLQDLKAQYNRIVALIAGNIWILLLRRHTRIVVLSEVALQYYIKWIPPEKLFVVYNTRVLENKSELDALEMEELLSFKQESLLLGCNAMLTQRKGLDQVIKALPFIPNVKLWIVGDGKSMSSLSKLANSVGVTKRVYFAGYKQNAHYYLPYYDIYMMASRSEGFPLSLLEAMIYKKNIICSDIPILKEILSDNEVTFFELENIYSIVESIRIASETNKSEAAYQRYLNKYSPECFCQSYLDVYNI